MIFEDVVSLFPQGHFFFKSAAVAFFVFFPAGVLVVGVVVVGESKASKN